MTSGMLAVLGLLLITAAAVPLAMWRFDMLGSEAWLYVVGLAAVGFACLFVYRAQDGAPED